MKFPVLNLLPTERRQMLRQAEILHALRGAVITLSVAAAIVIAILITARFGLDRNLRIYQERAREAQEATIAEQGELLTDSIKQLNARLASVQKIQKEYVQWSVVLADLFGIVPTGVRLTNADLDRGTSLITLQGIAATRDALVGFQDALEASPRFEQPSSPVSNLLERESINFSMTITMTPP